MDARSRAVDGGLGAHPGWPNSTSSAKSASPDTAVRSQAGTGGPMLPRAFLISPMWTTKSSTWGRGAVGAAVGAGVTARATPAPGGTVRQVAGGPRHSAAQALPLLCYEHVTERGQRFELATQPEAGSRVQERGARAANVGARGTGGHAGGLAKAGGETPLSMSVGAAT